MSAIAILFTKYVRNGTYTIEQVPELWRDQVQAHLDEVDKDEKEQPDETD